jgi:DNA sulfur modification protein DndD
MKFTSIKMYNFRCFYGKTPEIILSTDSQRNITFFHGGTGAGKTSLMNAFTWVLYEKFSEAFANPEQIVNKRAIAEAKPGQPVECWVEISWEHDSKYYRVKRDCRVYKNQTHTEASKTRLFMQIGGDDGQWFLPPQQPEDIINQILPSSLHQYFFFDGERIEIIVRPDKKMEVSEATKMLLGVEVMNRAIRHLGEAKKSLENELQNTDDTKINNILNEQNKIEKEIDRLNKRLTEIQQELENQENLKRQVNNSLLELSASREIQEKRDNLENQKRENQDNLRKTKETLKKIISNRAYTVFLSGAAQEYRDIVFELKKQKKLTPGISKEFVNDLLKSKTCICGANLNEGSHGCNNVKELLINTSSSTVEEMANLIAGQVYDTDKQVESFWEQVDREEGIINQLRENLSLVETDLDDIQDKLRQDTNIEISNLQKRLDTIDSKIRELTLEMGASQQQLHDYQKELQSINKQFGKQQLNQEKQKIIQRRVKTTEDVIQRLNEVKNRQETHFRVHLEKRVQEIFSEISPTPYLPRINEKYELNLIENTAGIEMSVPASTGENQILCLSFIGGILERVREWSNKKTFMGPDTGTYPIVMDSPFGSLDAIYRLHIAKKLPNIANQLIVFVTKTQFRGEVETEMGGRMGREYVLTYYSSKPNCKTDYIKIAGEEYPLIKQSPNDFEYTEIMEVTRF